MPISTEHSSVALSRSGARYPAGAVGSQTHLLDIPPELAALARAVYHNDVHVAEVRTVVADSAAPISPAVLALLADHGARTGTPIRYVVRDGNGSLLFRIDDVRDAIPFYRTPTGVLATIAARIPDAGIFIPDRRSGTRPEHMLQDAARAACARNFPTRDGASGYGAALLTKTGDIYYSGQYSTFDKRFGVHAEMGVLINALMDGVRDITAFGVASTKSKEAPCSPCGGCRQFIAEMSRVYNLSFPIHLFAFENDRSESCMIEELLPLLWSNKKA